MRYLNEDELTLASRFLFLSMTILVIQQDIYFLQTGSFKAFKIKESYLEVLTRMEQLAFQERKNLRKTMQKKRIQVVKLEKNDSFSSYLFICRGREEKRNYFNPAIRKKVKLIFEELMKKSILKEQCASLKT
ncbi:hypothetical protein CAI16_09135 [Virgibacillus dokdonensis]|uniref:Uncharacterized protein n=1 Tax=Virgibacillus dokdonensis TaxID=302167 RepID=A0A3E0WS78_9BACI|nr:MULTISPECIES: hypothetical protein [Virgibacillus]RFA35259.1 hypothetical protein CAI16_09135 [Virgibacillus dokdonensis]